MNSSIRHVAIFGFLQMYLASPQAASVADLIEKRVPAPPSAGTRRLTVGTELAAPVPFPSVTKLRDGRLMMIGSGKVTYSSDNGQTWSTAAKLPVAVDYVISLQSGKIGGPVPEKPASSAAVEQGELYFYVSADEGKTWQKRGQISASRETAWPYPKTMIQMQQRSPRSARALHGWGRTYGPVRSRPFLGHTQRKTRAD